MIRFATTFIVIALLLVYFIGIDFARLLPFVPEEPLVFSLPAFFIMYVMFRLGTAPLRRVVSEGIANTLFSSVFTILISTHFDSPFHELIKLVGAPVVLLSHFVATGRRHPPKKTSEETPRASLSDVKPQENKAPKSTAPTQQRDGTSDRPSPKTKDLEGFVTLTPSVPADELDKTNLSLPDRVHVETTLEIPERAETIEARNVERNDAKLIVAPIATKSDYMNDNMFIQDSLRYASMKLRAQPTEVPFQQYWPTFRSLSADQLKWYLWWRADWLAGSTKETFTSYLFLLAYELINFTLIPDKQRAFTLLKRLHDDFRFVGPIDNHLSRWTADMAWELGLDDEAFELYTVREPGVAQTIGMMLNRQSATPDVELDTLITRYRYRSVHFDNNERDLRRLFREAIRDGMDYFKQQDIDFFAALGRSTDQRDSQPWKPYNSALICRHVHFRPLYRAAQPAHIQCMQDFLKTLENLHRELTSTRQPLKVNYLPDDVQNFIEERKHEWESLPRVAAPKPEAPTPVKNDVQPVPQTNTGVTIDPQLLEQLKRETEASQRLAAAWLDESSGASESSEPKPVTPVPADSEPSPRVETPPPVISGATSVPDRFIDQLTPRARHLLHEVRRQKEWSRANAEAWARSESVMLTSVLDEINDPVLEHFDYPLIYIEDDRLRLDEETMDLLTEHLNLEVTDGEEHSAS